VAAGAVGEVLGGGGGGGIVVRVDDPTATAARLSAAGIAAEVDGATLRVAMAPSEAATLNQLLAGLGIWASELRPDESDLEALFLAPPKTRRSPHDDDDVEDPVPVAGRQRDPPVPVRRALHVLIAIALVGIAAMAVLAAVLTDPAQISPPGDGGQYDEATSPTSPTSGWAPAAASSSNPSRYWASAPSSAAPWWWAASGRRARW
jgi:hypothetical protein